MRSPASIAWQAGRLVRVLVPLAMLLFAAPVLSVTVTYGYDSLGRLTVATYADGTVIQYQYDANGNRTIYTVTRPTATGTLQLTAAATSVGEGAGSVTITATRSGGNYGAASVHYATANGTATAGSDYTAISGNFNWGDGDTTSKTVTIAVINDTAVESSETFTLTLSAATGATLGTPAVNTVTITDNDNPPAGTLQLSASSYSVAENITSVTITATRAGGSFGAVGVNYATSNGTATSGSDYTAASGTLSWANGDAANKSFAVTILNDAVSESTESFTSTVSTPTGGATLGTPSSATVTITDDDSGAPSVPLNIRKSPTTGTSGNYSILWGASTGTINHYTLEEVQSAPGPLTTTYSVTSAFKGFNYGNTYHEFVYRVRACATSSETQCSAYSSSVFKLVCPAAPVGCP